MLWLHRLMSPHLVHLCINLVWYSKSLYSTSVTLLQESIWWKESLILCGSFIFFNFTCLFKCKKVFCLKNKPGQPCEFSLNFVLTNESVCLICLWIYFCKFTQRGLFCFCKMFSLHSSNLFHREHIRKIRWNKNTW